MSTVFQVHGEIAGRVQAAGGTTAEASAAEGLNVTYRIANFYCGAGGPTDIHGNGGAYHITSNHANNGVDFTPVHDSLIDSNVPEGMVRINYQHTGAQAFYYEVLFTSGTNNNNEMVRLTFNTNGSIQVETRDGTSHVVRGTTSPLTLNQWNTVWLYFRSSMTVSGSGSSATGSADGRVALWTTSPYGAGTADLDWTGPIFRSASASTPDNASTSSQFVNIRSSVLLDDIVSHTPSLRFTSSGGTLPAVGSVIMYTDGGGNEVRAKLAGVKNLGTNQSNQAMAAFQLTHMTYTPNGGSATDYDGKTWSGTENVWGSGQITITDTGANTLGTGFYEGKRSAFPRPGHFMPAAVPKATHSNSNLTKSDQAQSAIDHINDNGGPPSEADYLFATAAQELWAGAADAPAVGGNTDALTVTGTVTVERVLTYAWARESGSGDGLGGMMQHFNTPTSGPTTQGNTADTFPVTLSPNWSLSIREHDQSGQGSNPPTEWDVAKVNAADFGVRFF